MCSKLPVAYSDIPAHGVFLRFGESAVEKHQIVNLSLILYSRCTVMFYVC